jgi:hypothetical protein
VTGVAHAVERLSLVPLVGGALFQVVTGVSNIFHWYWFPFFFFTTTTPPSSSSAAGHGTPGVPGQQAGVGGGRDPPGR